MIYVGHITAAIADIGAAIAAAGDLETADPRVLAPIAVAARSLADEVDAAINALDAEIASAAPLVAEGGFAPDMAAALMRVDGAIRQLVELHDVRGLAGRVLINLRLAGAP